MSERILCAGCGKEIEITWDDPDSLCDDCHDQIVKNSDVSWVSHDTNNDKNE
jgi:NMD protein affecting ribosome stability and mRNA decay